jgi:hypothetical protein
LRTIARDYPNDAAVGQCLAAGLCFALLVPKTEEDVTAEANLRELLDELDDDAAFRARLAQPLNPMPNNSKKEKNASRRDLLLKELRALARTYPNDAVVRKWLILGLSNARSVAEGQGELAQADDFLHELRALALAYPDDLLVREAVARSED